MSAFTSAVTVLVTPGPAVTTATPGTPVIRAVASAANTAFASSRVSITSIPIFLHPTSIGEICPPHRVKIRRTPSSFKTAAIISPLFI